MANEEHLKNLKQGVEVWNRWREENPGVRPDLSRAELIGEVLIRANLSEADLSGAHLSGAYLIKANLIKANLRGANLSGEYLRGEYLRGEYRHEEYLPGEYLSSADLSEADLHWADLSGANLRGANLSEADLSEAFLIGADLSGADLSEAKLSGADLSGADLSEANLSAANLCEADLSGANLHWAYLRRADLRGADLRAANLSTANLSAANLSATHLNETNLGEATVGSTTFADLDLSAVKGLDTVRHLGPSYISIDTIYHSHGQIPEKFLRGAGVPDNFIAYMGSLIGKAFEYYSCFISYSTRDQAFAERLHNDLQDKGVRCWFAPEDIAGGKKIYEPIDRAIRLHDKTLLVLSEHSIGSQWVMTEIRRTRKAEVRDGRRKLFPIRLVAWDVLKEWECFDADTGKDLAAEVREYFIPDFSTWKEHDSYQRAFDRLLRDLKAEEA